MVDGGGGMTTLSQIAVPATKKVKDTEAFLKGKHNQLSAYESLENLVVDGEDDLGPSTYNGLMHHMLAIRVALAKGLWQTEVYVGVSIIDELVSQ